ncbi:NUDIX hydrolase [Treponema sp. OMZ 840]
MNNNLIWEVNTKTGIYKTPVFTINDQQAVSPAGEKKSFITVNAPDWVITVPVLSANDMQKSAGISEPCFLLVKQWRAGENKLSIEFPGGVINEGEAPEDAALRELREETGFKAENCTLLGTMNPNPALFCNTVYFFTATALSDIGKPEPDEDEFLQPLVVPIGEVYKKMGRPPYIHALMAAALYLYGQSDT